MVGDADLADVVERSALEEHLDLLVAEGRPEPAVRAQREGERPNVVLGATDVVAGLVVPGLGERGEGEDGDVLDRAHLAGALVDELREVVGVQAQRVAGLLELHVGPDPRQEHRGPHRLAHEVDRAQLEAGPLAVLVVDRGEEDDRDVGGGGRVLEAPAHLVAVEPGHHHVEDDEVGGRGGGEGQGALARGRDEDPVVAAEELRHDREVLRGVVDDEHGRRPVRSRTGCGRRIEGRKHRRDAATRGESASTAHLRVTGPTGGSARERGPKGSD